MISVTSHEENTSLHLRDVDSGGLIDLLTHAIIAKSTASVNLSVPFQICLRLVQLYQSMKQPEKEQSSKPYIT